MRDLEELGATALKLDITGKEAILSVVNRITAEQDPNDPSRLRRPIPVLGQLPASKTGFPAVFFMILETASRLVGVPLASGARSSTVMGLPSVPCNDTLLP